MYKTMYHIAGEFDGNNVWLKWMDKHLIDEKVWRINKLDKRWF